MELILVHAQALVYTLLGLMPSAYQRDSLQVLLGLFLEAQGRPLSQHSPLKSPGALSRFLDHYSWPTRRIIRVRQPIVEQWDGVEGVWMAFSPLNTALASIASVSTH